MWGFDDCELFIFTHQLCKKISNDKQINNDVYRCKNFLRYLTSKQRMVDPQAVLLSGITYSMQCQYFEYVFKKTK